MVRLSGRVNSNEPKRFDVYFVDESEKNISLTRSQLKTRLKELIINGKPAKLSSKVKAGDTYDIVLNDEESTEIVPESIPLEIIFENNDLWVINKPQGMVTHPAHGNWTGTLANALLGRFDTKNDMPHRAGIVHRLDKETSGVIIAAKNLYAQEFLSMQFRQRTTEKFYIALVFGKPPHNSGTIDTWIARDTMHRQRFTVSKPEIGKHALSEYKLIKTFTTNETIVSLLLVKIKTGRTHQIRVHCKYLGCPIIGDTVYRTRASSNNSVTLMLHAYYIKIKLPITETVSEFIAPIPERFITYCNALNYALDEQILLNAIHSWNITATK
ncbi:MAG TPA: RluA family pseudouridine synthase [Spirochaetales bacterium]|nr:RluA family pseudouridine synthase [Spirochaetales bacterium]HQG40303.1 RluA family pseudouridine synthase [Spirochaetales bacterium]HQK34518.1 RluA family pseudouridine synthase [Spirochaetales bacterium]